MTLTPEQLKERNAGLIHFNEIDGIPVLMDRFQPDTGWDYRWYGIPENRKGKKPRSFPINPVSYKALGQFVELMKALGWDGHVIGILTGGTRADRTARSGQGYISPHSIFYGKQSQKLWCTAIDIDGIIWKFKDGHVVIYTANRSMAPRHHSFKFGFNTGYPELDFMLQDGSPISIEPAHNTPYVVVADLLSQCFGTVLHDKCSGRTGVNHRDHFHVDKVRPLRYREYPRSNSQDTLIQMTLNLDHGCDLEVDGKIYNLSTEEWQKWARMRDIKWTTESEMWSELMHIAPIRHGTIK